MYRSPTTENMGNFDFDLHSGSDKCKVRDPAMQA